MDQPLICNGGRRCLASDSVMSGTKNNADLFDGSLALASLLSDLLREFARWLR